MTPGDSVDEHASYGEWKAEGIEVGISKKKNPEISRTIHYQNGTALHDINPAHLRMILHGEIL